MSRIKIKNFGPIKDGCQENDGWIDIKKVTVFIGNQGSGKSTVAKLISTLLWIEKSILNGNISDLTETDFIEEYCNYFRLKKYFREQTEIDFHGEYFIIEYKNDIISFQFKEPEDLYKIPKIMYVPAERSFLSSVEHADKVSGLPLPLVTFQVEFERSLAELNERLQLPLEDYQLRYDQHKNIAYIIGKDYELDLNAASSGLHSSIPLFVVSRNLSRNIALGKEDTSISNLNSKQFKKRIAEMRAAGVMGNNNFGSAESQTIEEKRERKINSMFKNSVFVNIVEEPEQNLYPISQKEMLYSLLEFNNMLSGNKLIITTHSPYLINYLTLAVQGNHLFKLMESKVNVPKELYAKLEAIIPEKSSVSGNEVIVYQLSDGEIKLLPSPQGFPSSKNDLNLSIAEGNYFFDQMLEIEQELS